MKKVIVYICIVVIAAYGIRELFYLGLTSNEVGVFDKFNTMFSKKNNYKTIILGSSRAESHFNCYLIDSALHTNSYNLGIEGASLPLTLDLFDAYLEKGKFPDNIILHIDYHIKKCNNDTVFMFPRYFPYLNNKSLYNALKKRDKRFISFRYLPLYGLPYMRDNYLAAALRGYLNKPGQYDLKFYKGYVPVLPSNYIAPVKWKYLLYDACDEGIIYSRMDTLITNCKRNNTKLYLVLSPMYYKATLNIKNRTSIIQKMKEKAKMNELLLLDYTHDSLCYNSIYFADPYHMNEKGSKLFTLKLVNDLKHSF